MANLYIFLSIFFAFSLILNYLKVSEERTAFEIVNDMGIGYNLGNSFDNYYSKIKIETPDEQITLNGNSIPTRNLIIKLKKYGFKTIRFPITWINFIDDKGNINSEWLYRVKEVVTWITNAKLYCIINVQTDGYYGNWLSEGLESKDKYINLWSQIANEFKDYNEYLIFESMNQPEYFDYDIFYYDYNTLLILSQAFVDTIRNSSNLNKQRLLLISGPYADLDSSIAPKFHLPKDPINKLALSLQYFNPYEFVLQNYYEPWNFTDDYGYTIIYQPSLTWGNDNDYKQLFTDFNSIKSNFLEKNIPVVITALGVLTEEKKELKSIREYLYSVFSLSMEYNGMMACLWDSSKDIKYKDNYVSYNMNYYNREEDKWFDEKLQNIILQISRGKYIKLSDYYVKTNKDILIEPNNYGNYYLKIGNRKPLKIIFNARIKGKLFKDINIGFSRYNSSEDLNEIEFENNNLKREYDGTSTIIIDISDKNCKYYIRVNRLFGNNNNLVFNNLTVEFEDSFYFFDYESYKYSLKKYVN